MRLVAQLVELDLTTEQLDVFHRHSEARRIARNDLIAEFKVRKARDEKVVLKTLRPWFNAIKDRKHAWMRSCSQNAVKGGLIDAVDALQRFFKGQNKFPKFEPKGKHCRFRIDNGVNTVKVEQRAESATALPQTASHWFSAHERSITLACSTGARVPHQVQGW